MSVFGFVTMLIVLINTIKPPVVAQDIYVGTPNLNNNAFHSPESHEDDLHIGGGYNAPKDFAYSDRKDLFYTFLIIGLDGGVNTDTLMVASYDGVNMEANVIGIPRDSLVNVKRSIKKINAAYPVGTLNGGGKDGGIAQLQREIKTLIGFVPDYYVLVNFDACIKLIDAIDGINVNVPMNMIYDDPAQNLHINISRGNNILSGKEALQFARYRKGNNASNTITDYQRIENQQAVIKGTIEKLLNPVYLLKIPEFIEIFNENVYTNLTAEEILWFAEQVTKIKGSEALSTYTLPTNGASGPPSYYEYLDEDSIIELVNSTVNPYNKEIRLGDLDIISGGY